MSKIFTFRPPESHTETLCHRVNINGEHMLLRLHNPSDPRDGYPKLVEDLSYMDGSGQLIQKSYFRLNRTAAERFLRNYIANNPDGTTTPVNQLFDPIKNAAVRGYVLIYDPDGINYEGPVPYHDLLIDESTGVGTFSFSYTFSRPHPAGSKVSWFIDPNDIVSRVYAHEAGHLINLGDMPNYWNSSWHTIQNSQLPAGSQKAFDPTSYFTVYSDAWGNSTLNKGTDVNTKLPTGFQVKPDANALNQ